MSYLVHLTFITNVSVLFASLLVNICTILSIYFVGPVSILSRAGNYHLSD